MLDHGGLSDRSGGDVDDTLIVSIHGNVVWTDTFRGKSAENVPNEVEHYQSHEFVRLFLRDLDGVRSRPRPAPSVTGKIKTRFGRRKRRREGASPSRLRSSSVV